MPHLPDIDPPVLEQLGPPDVPEVITYLDVDAVLNVYLLALVLRDALARPRDEYWVARRAGRITALLFLGGTSGAVLPVGDDGEGLRLLGEQATRRLELLPRRFQVIGPRIAVAALLERFPGEGRTPRLQREQTYLSLEPGRMLWFDRLPELRAARREDYAMLYETGAALRAEELLEDPREVDAVAYARRVDEDCRDGHTLVWRDARGLVFRAGLSALTADAAQISGVYTLPQVRGQGVATRALAEMCTRLFTRSRCVCLFVNNVNEPALKLYRRLGFTTRSPWASAFYGQPR
ncbi:MAG: GNAT family N-acetyltransferase [Candidatus Eisenbacteria bacterium]